MVAGAVRTDFILSAEIMAIALAEVASEPFLTRPAILVLVALAITVGVSGAVGMIGKMDDIGLPLAERRYAGSRALARALVTAIARLTTALSVIRLAGIFWVGGGTPVL